MTGATVRAGSRTYIRHRRRGYLSKVALCGLIVTGLLVPRGVRASSIAPWDSWTSHLQDTLGGSTLVWVGASALATGAMVGSGVDHGLRVAIQRHGSGPWFGQIGVVAGYILPLAVAPTVYLGGLAADDGEATVAGAAALQSLVFTGGTVFLLKWGTGRPFPLHGRPRDAPDRLDHPEEARDFDPFSGLWLAWPSGHTALSAALAAALTSSARQHRGFVALLTYPLAFGVGAAMLVGDHHWPSDVLAGAIMGQSIGWSVGSAFREERDRRGKAGVDAPRLRWNIVPMPHLGGAGLVMVF